MWGGPSPQIAHARVPLIKLYDPETGVNCDVCVGNDGVYKSAVLGVFADLDERYRDLVFLVKMWAKRFDCNDATAGSFNSFALSLMSLFHLQTRSPPILPPVLRLTLPSDAAADADLAAERERPVAHGEGAGGLLGSPFTMRKRESTEQKKVRYCGNGADQRLPRRGPGATPPSSATWPPAVVLLAGVCLDAAPAPQHTKSLDATRQPASVYLNAALVSPPFSQTWHLR